MFTTEREIHLDLMKMKSIRPLVDSQFRLFIHMIRLRGEQSYTPKSVLKLNRPNLFMVCTYTIPWEEVTMHMQTIHGMDKSPLHSLSINGKNTSDIRRSSSGFPPANQGNLIVPPYILP